MSEWLKVAIIWTAFFWVMGFCIMQCPEPSKTQLSIIFTFIYFIFCIMGRELFKEGEANG